MYVVVVLATLIAADNIGGGRGRDHFTADKAWIYVIVLSIGYMLARGWAKSGTRERYWDTPEGAGEGPPLGERIKAAATVMREGGSLRGRRRQHGRSDTTRGPGSGSLASVGFREREQARPPRCPRITCSSAPMRPLVQLNYFQIFQALSRGSAIPSRPSDDCDGGGSPAGAGYCDRPRPPGRTDRSIVRVASDGRLRGQQWESHGAGPHRRRPDAAGRLGR